MTPERLKELQAVMDELIDREVARLVRDETPQTATTSQLTALAEIKACISTAYKLLSGEFGREIFGKRKGAV